MSHAPHLPFAFSDAAMCYNRSMKSCLDQSSWSPKVAIPLTRSLQARKFSPTKLSTDFDSLNGLPNQTIHYSIGPSSIASGSITSVRHSLVIRTILAFKVDSHRTRN